VGDVLPEVIAYEENGRDAKAVNYARLAPVLIEAVKEQQNAIHALKEQNQEKDAQIASLAARIESLEGTMRVDASGGQKAPLGFLPTMVWWVGGGLGLLLVTPGLVRSYHRIRRDE
jgi:hypothetical protein